MHTVTLLAIAMVITQLSACNHGETMQVGSNTYCVPKENLIEPIGWLEDATGNMRHDGFAFVLTPNLLLPTLNYRPAPNIKGEPMAISGTVEPARHDEWLSSLPPDNYWRGLAEGPNAIIEHDKKLHQIRAYQTPTRDRWIVWGIDPSFDLKPTSIPKGGSIVAHCDRTDFRTLALHKVDETTICRRRVIRDDLLISYSFGESNLPILPELDSDVRRVIHSWQCKK
jgi:hypothetical protein